ncbi:hypothetical protein D3C75_700920 [compost metagenome]
MRGEQVLPAAGLDAACRERSRSGNHTVHYDRNSVRGCAQNHSGKPGNFQSSHLGEHIDGIPGIGAVDPDRLLDHLDLGVQRLRRYSRSKPGDHLNRLPGQHRNNSAAWRRVADPHFT